MKNYLKIFSIISFFILSSHLIFAQNSTTETLEKGETYLEGNFWTATQSHQKGGMQIYGGRIAYGLTKKLEVGIGGSFSNPHDVEFPPEIQPGVKYKFYENEKYGITASGGVLGFIPVAKSAGTDRFAMVYSNVSKDIAKLKGARFTVGGYALVGRNKDFGTRKGWNLAYDQPLNEKVTFSAQWTTGKNRFGYFTPGFNVSLPKNNSLFIGYSVGNYDYDNHGPYISYSVYK